MEIWVRLLIAGVMVGSLYGLVAVTLTLMLRSNGILSFAHAGFAMMSAYVYLNQVCPKDVVQNRPCGDRLMSPVVAAAFAILLAVVAALLVERLVARPLARASAASKVIGTAAVLALISGIMLQIYGSQGRAIPVEIPGRHILPKGSIEVAGVLVTKSRLSIFIISLLILTLLALVLRRSWFGLGVRAAGQLPDASRLMGVNPVAVSRFNWALGGFLAGLAGVLIGPLTSINVGTFSFLLVKAVAAVLIGALVSLPLTFAGGILVGIAEALAPRFWATPGVSELAIAGLVLTMLVLLSRKFAVVGYTGPVQQIGPAGPVATAVARGLNAFRDLTGKVPRPIWVLVGLGVLAAPLRSGYFASIGTVGLFYGLMALSVIVITGTTGQLTFMQAGFAAVGGFGVTTALDKGWGVPVSIGVVVAACVAIGILTGLISLRFRGLQFAIASLAVGAVLSEFVVTRPWVKPIMTDPQLFGRSLLESKYLYQVMLVAAVIALVLVGNVRRSGWGRTLNAMREMHTRVGHFGVAPMRAEVALLGISAGVAGLAGAFFAITITAVETGQFVPLVSVTIVLTAVVGGMRSLWGAVIAALVFGPGQEVIGRIFSTGSANAIPQIASASLALVLIVALPNGLSSLFEWAREVVARAPDGPEAARFRGLPVPLLTAPPAWIGANGGSGRPAAGNGAGGTGSRDRSDGEAGPDREVPPLPERRR
ncbi:MAG: ABC transporter permease [Actinomycetota bacterium]